MLARSCVGTGAAAARRLLGVLAARAASGVASSPPPPSPPAPRSPVAPPPPPPPRAPPATLFSVPFLHGPADFPRAAAAAVDVCAPLVAAVAADAAAPGGGGLATLHRLDAVSDTLCKVLDAAECARSLHAGPRWRAAADAAFTSLSAFMYNLNASRPLYAALRALTDAGAPFAGLTPEQRRMALLLRREFERDGIHLPDDARAAVVRLNADVAALAADFSARAHAPAPRVPLRAPAGERALAALAPGLRAALPPPPSFAEKVRAGLPGAPVVLPAEPPVVEAVLRLCPDRAAREALLRGANADSAGALPVLASLVGRRAALAAAIGFDSYAAFVSSDRMAGSPAAVVAFLRTLARALAPRLALELAELAAASAAEGGAPPPGLPPGAAAGGAGAPGADAPIMRRLHATITRGVGGDVALWDMPFLSRAVTAREYWPTTAASAGAGVGAGAGAGAGAGGGGEAAPAASDPLSADANAVAEYLPLSAALDGLSLIMRRVFGVACVRVPLAPGEGWDVAPPPGAGAGAGTAGAGAAGGGGGAPAPPPPPPSSSRRSAHPRLVKLVLRHEEEGALGTLYLDPLARAGKVGGAAHYVVRCGKRLHAHDGALEAALEGEAAAAAAAAADAAAGGGALPPRGAAAGAAQTFQLPVIALVTNMAPPDAPGGGGGGDDDADPLARVLLTPGELETLFHEWGHATHSLLSRTEFQHLSGTRGALDFVETPSHVFEHWARDARVVRAFARHHATGAPLPEGLWERVQAARAHFAGAELAASLANALFDQALHGSPAARAAALAGPPVTAAEAAHIADAALAAVARRAREGGPRARAADLAPPGFLPGSGGGGGGGDDDAAPELVIPLAPPDTLRPLPERAGEPPAPAADSTALFHAIAAAYTLAGVPGPEGAPGGGSPAGAGGATSSPSPPYAWHARFSHLGSYGGGYYTYSYAAAFSADVWGALFAADPFSRASGERWRREVLARGAADDPATMLTALLGRPPSLGPLLRELGLLPPRRAA